MLQKMIKSKFYNLLICGKLNIEKIHFDNKVYDSMPNKTDI